MKKLLLVLTMAFITFCIVSCDGITNTTKEEVTTELDLESYTYNEEYWLFEIMLRKDKNKDGLYTYYFAEYGDLSTYREEVYMRYPIKSDKLFSVGELVLYIEINDKNDQNNENYILVDFEN